VSPYALRDKNEKRRGTPRRFSFLHGFVA